MPRHRKKIIDVASAIVLIALVILDAITWKTIFTAYRAGADAARIYFLPVTQGESALLVLPNDVTILTDAGPDAGIVDDLQKAMPLDRPSYIDLAIISYPQSADYEGYEYILDHYEIGAFIYNGRNDDSYKTEWQQLAAKINAKHIPLITVGAGDRIHYGQDDEIDVLSPDNIFAQSPEPSDTGIVTRVITPAFTVMFASDIGTDVEEALLAQRDILRATILKAPFPGLGTASGDAFLLAIDPKTVVITPGIKNTASVPTKAMLAHLASSTRATIVTTGHDTFLLYNK